MAKSEEKTEQKPVATVQPHCTLYGASLETLRDIISKKDTHCNKLTYVTAGGGGSAVGPGNAQEVESVRCTSINPLLSSDLCTCECIYYP